MKSRVEIVVAFVITAILVTALLPSGENFNFTSAVGQQWERSTLVTPFDFSIEKSAEERASEIAKIEADFIPIYRLDRQQWQVASEAFLQSYDTLSSSAAKKSYNLLKQIYNVGIIPADMVTKHDAATSLELIRLVRGGVITTLTTENLYTPKQAREALASALPKTHGATNNVGRYVVANLSYQSLLSKQDLEQQIADVTPIKEFVDKGTTLVSRGQIIDPHTHQMLNSYLDELKYKGAGSSSLWTILGNFIYVSIILTLTYLFLYQFRETITKKEANVIFILAIYLMFVVAMFVIGKIDSLSEFIIPFAIVPIYIVTFYDIRMSIFEYIAVILICAPMSAAPFDFFVVNVTAGIAGVFVLQRSYSRHRQFLAMGVIFATYMLSYYSLAFIRHSIADALNWYVPLWFAINVMLLMVLYQSIYLIEKLFGFVTNITLLELCDTNNRLLRELAERAPGTFQHSLQVASLAEEAAAKIGANPLLARTGALYHDIGKGENPFFFIENVPNESSPHLKLTALESAQIIKRHVSDGAALARKANLPQVIIDFINSHHGTSVISYFLHQYSKTHPEMSEQEIDQFRYDGIRPTTKEESICMMADAVEAASRSMKERPLEEILEVVDKIIDKQISEGQLSDSTLSFAELTAIKEVFKMKIGSIHHTRIVYPE